MSLLALSGIGVALGGREVLDDVSLRVGEGEFVGLIGPNGAGKSTLLRAALGLVAARGTAEIGGMPAARLSARERALRIAYLPQEREIAWPVSVEMLVGLGRAPHRGPLTAPGVQDRAAVDAALARMEIAAFRHRQATALSGGEKARVLIARALAQEAPLLLADEPTAGLDPEHQIGLMRLFADLAREGRGVVASLHDLGLAARWCTRLVLLDRGRIVADGPPRQVLSPQRLRDIYAVEAFFGEAAGGLVVQPLDLTTQNAKDERTVLR